MKTENGKSKIENPEVETCKREIQRLRGIISTLDEEMGAIDKLLAPVWSLESSCQDEIRDTLPWSFSGHTARAAPFARLLQIAIEWGSTKIERRRLMLQINGYQREVKTLTHRLKKLTGPPQ